MRGLLQLFAAYGGGLLFVLLEAISITLIVQYNQRQGEIASNSMGLFTAYIDNTSDWLTDYLGLKNEVIKLQSKNIKLLEQLDNARYSNAVFRDSIKEDSLKQMYTFIGANVISNSILSSNNSLRLDRGSRQGVRPNMGVISDGGIVGIVRNTTEHFSQVMSVLHSQARINASIRNSSYFGTLTWDGKDPRYMQLNAIPRYAEFKVGDIIESNGFSQIFPSGIVLGVISHIEEVPGNNFLKIQVELANDMAKVRYVYVVNNLMRYEHDELDKATDE
ncbi:MAG: rod shape-determining protein MreC [Lewinellaceae bacterium]|nr:rod shape-determining protein MreC [Phaeodactylibacter sp.]MCB9348175.1 rod shape-determining protein MreC [Lewinellaceae bacterium]